MPKIKKAIYWPERRIVTISEYQSILNANPYRKSLDRYNLRCVECGDKIKYCHGEIKEAYFGHSPSRFGGKHINCPLFTHGVSISESESKIRRKFVEDTDIALNFELKMIGNKWSSFITIPPFFTKEIDNYSSKNANICISTESNKIAEIPIDRDHFSVGSIKHIGLSGFPLQIYLNIKTSESSHGLYYRIDGFSADEQIYRTLITQEYITNSASAINLSNIKFFNCKRTSGKVYTGRHYIIFVRDYSYFHNNAFASLKEEDALIKQIVLPKDNSFNYRVYDVVFKHANQRTEDFCDSRGCTLVEESNANILWPPVNYVGNYKYIKKNSKALFITFENKSNALDMYTKTIDDNVTGLRIKNENMQPYYLAVSMEAKETKQPVFINESEQVEISFTNDSSNYLFYKGVLNKRIDEKKYTLKKNESVISILNRLEIEKYICPNNQKTTSNDEILAMIRYSEKLVTFNENEYEYLADKYRDNSLISNYLNSCLEYKRIKENVKDYLMEEKL